MYTFVLIHPASGQSSTLSGLPGPRQAVRPPPPLRALGSVGHAGCLTDSGFSPFTN